MCLIWLHHFDLLGNRANAIKEGLFLRIDSERAKGQRKRDDNKNKICTFRGGGWAGGQGGKLSKTLFFMGNVMTINFECENFIVETFCCRGARGEGVVRGNGCPKGCLWRVRFVSASFSARRVLRSYGATPLICVRRPGGGVFEKEAWEGRRALAECLWGGRGGGLNIFWGAEIPTIVDRN